MTLTVRAIDVGFGQTKYVRRITDGTIECAHFPSRAVWTIADPSKGSTLGGRRKTVAFRINDLYYEVGPEVELALSNYRAAMPMADYVKTPEHLALLRGALHYIDLESIDLLVVGLPVAMLASRKAALERLATGEHPIGRGRYVRIKQTLAIAQPQGALVAYAAEHKALAKLQSQESLVIDAGSRTFDWLVTRGLRLVSGHSHSVDVGVSSIVRAIARAISTDIGETYSALDSIDAALRRERPLRIFGKAYPIEPYRPIVEAMAHDAVRTMLANIGDRHRFDNIVLVGGGSDLFKAALSEAFGAQRIQEVVDPICANVRGYQIAGMDRVASMRGQHAAVEPDSSETAGEAP